MPDDALTYRTAGVNIDEAQRALRAVVPQIQATYTERVVAGVGGFGGLFHAQFSEFERPILVSSIDGVGTKTKVAAMAGQYRGLGHDIVNHCVNDILCQGAQPLFFLDYFGTSHLHGTIFEDVVGGAAEACAAVGCALIGGETAEMPGVYCDEEIDIVGAIVGVVDYDKRYPRSKMQPGDAVVGIASDGLHTNGFSLARRALFELGSFSMRDEVQGLATTIGEELIRPHRSYFSSVYPVLMESEGVFAAAHITGGGLYDNIPRVLPSDIQVVIDRRSWTPHPIFHLIQKVGEVSDVDMYRTFNMGIGMVLICNRDAAPAIVQLLNQSGEWAAIIGQTQKGANEVQIV
jgi:phosphoribosylformylglycinamidine cyclo-ligase